MGLNYIVRLCLLSRKKGEGRKGREEEDCRCRLISRAHCPAYTKSPSTQEIRHRQRQEDHKFKAILGFIAILRPAWAMRDSVSRKRRERKVRRKKGRKNKGGGKQKH